MNSTIQTNHPAPSLLVTGQLKNESPTQRSEKKQANAQTSGAAQVSDRTATSLKRTAIASFKQSFSSTANNPEAFQTLLSSAFGSNYDSAAGEQLRQRSLSGDYSWLPKVEVVRETLLPPGANGAYNAKEGVVYLNSNLANKPELAARTINEEIGHHIDTLVNSSDAAGDEGEIFARTLSGEKLSENTLQTLRSEDDHGTINVNGKEVEVEFFLKKLVKKVTGAVKKVAKGVGSAVKGVGKAVTSVAKKAVDVVKGIGSPIVNALKSVGGGLLGTVKNLVSGKFGDAFKSLLSLAGTAAPFLLGPVGGLIGLGGSLGGGLLGFGSKLLGPLSGLLGNAGGGVFSKLLGGANSLLGPFSSLLGGGKNMLGELVKKITDGVGIAQKLFGNPMNNLLGSLFGQPNAQPNTPVNDNQNQSLISAMLERLLSVRALLQNPFGLLQLLFR